MQTMNGVPFRKLLVDPSKWNIKAPYSMNPKKLTLHETDNEMPAINEIRYMNSNNNQTSYHIAVDHKEVIQGIPFNRNAWHAGDGKNGYGNRNTIGMEICHNYDRSRATTNLLEPLSSKYQQGVKNAIKVGAQILIDNNIVANNANIKTHNDWNGKHCPRKMRNDGQVLIIKAGIILEYNRLKGIKIDPKPIIKQPVTTKVDGHLSLNQVVDKAIAGGYGNVPERVANINNRTNYNYTQIQPEINKRFKVTAPAKEVKTREQVAKEIASGKHAYGNNPDRARKLKAEGYDATWVQNRVNQLLKPTVKPEAPKIAPVVIEVGSKVLLHGGAKKYATGENIPSGRKNKTYTVQQTGKRNNKNQVLLKEIKSWVWESDVTNRATTTMQPEQTMKVRIGTTIRVKALYSNINGTTNARKSPINGYVAKTKSGGRNPIQLLNRQDGYIIGYTNENEVV